MLRLRKPCLPLGRILLSLLIAPATWLACATLALADPACVVAAVRGTVTLEHGDDPMTVVKGQAIEAGDIVTTQAGARIRLHFPDGSDVSLAENSVLQVTAASFDATGNRNILLELLKGIVRSAAAKKHTSTGSSFEIRTPLAISAVRGTQWIVMARPAETRVYVEEGRVAVGANFATSQFSKLIEAGHWVSVNRKRGVGAIQDSAPGTLKNLIDETQAATLGIDATPVQVAQVGAATTPGSGSGRSSAASAGASPIGNTAKSTLNAVGGVAASTAGAVGRTTAAALNTLGGATASTLNAVGGITAPTLNALGDTTASTLNSVGATTVAAVDIVGTASSLAGSTLGVITGSPAASATASNSTGAPTSARGGAAGNGSGSGGAGAGSGTSGGGASGGGSPGGASGGSSSGGGSASSGGASSGGASGGGSSGGGSTGNGPGSSGSGSGSNNGSPSGGGLGGAVHGALGTVGGALGGLLH